jgi:hypothetical protein
MKPPRKHLPHKPAEKKKREKAAQAKNPPAANLEDPLGTLFPGLTAKQREVVLQLQARAGEIQQWFAGHPGRVAELQKRPHETLGQLSHALGIALPVALPENLPNLTVVLNPLICVCGPPPKSLINAVWEFIGQSDANLALWNTNAIQVIDDVAASTGASDQDRVALISAFERVFAGGSSNPLVLLQRLQGVKPTQLQIQ